MSFLHAPMEQAQHNTLRALSFRDSDSHLLMAHHHSLLILQVFLTFQFLIQSHPPHWSGVVGKSHLEELTDTSSRENMLLTCCQQK